jgi:hypothetical protein
MGYTNPVKTKLTPLNTTKALKYKNAFATVVDKKHTDMR